MVERRVVELRRRRAELAEGKRPSVASVDFARQRARDAVLRAEDAHRASAQRHEELARIHERLANDYQRAAMRAHDGAPDRLQERADRHWQAAHDSHLRSVEDEVQARKASS
jgi:hypothetical protein